MLYLCRGVCAASGLCLPAVPKGQTDQAGVPDSLFPGSLCSCWCGFSLCHLPDIHRLVQIVFQMAGRPTSSQLLYIFCNRNTIFKRENDATALLLQSWVCKMQHYCTHKLQYSWLVTQFHFYILSLVSQEEHMQSCLDNIFSTGP